MGIGTGLSTLVITSALHAEKNTTDMIAIDVKSFFVFMILKFIESDSRGYKVATLKN